jgi:hypothetical protein
MVGVTNLLLAIGKARRLIAIQTSNPLKKRESIAIIPKVFRSKRIYNTPR